ncbi:MAG: hypothetical protein ACE5G0_06500 [Rhodothermales bacterium]
MTNANFVIDLIGWVGAGALLVAYVLVSSERLEGSSTTYQLLNLVGAVFLIVNTAYYGAFPSAFLNVVWAGIAVLTMMRTKKKALEK